MNHASEELEAPHRRLDVFVFPNQIGILRRIDPVFRSSRGSVHADDFVFRVLRRPHLLRARISRTGLGARRVDGFRRRSVRIRHFVRCCRFVQDDRRFARVRSCGVNSDSSFFRSIFRNRRTSGRRGLSSRVRRRSFRRDRPPSRRTVPFRLPVFLFLSGILQRRRASREVEGVLGVFRWKEAFRRLDDRPWQGIARRLPPCVRLAVEFRFRTIPDFDRRSSGPYPVRYHGPDGKGRRLGNVFPSIDVFRL